MSYVIVFLGAGIGGALRHGVNILAARLFGIGFPFGTLAVNILGCFGMALVIEYFAFKAGLPQQARLFLTTGILGGFTTFSTFSLDTAVLFERGQLGLTALYVALSVGGSLLALFGGLALCRAVLGTAG
jgi:fluoride exporter